MGPVAGSWDSLEALWTRLSLLEPCEALGTLMDFLAPLRGSWYTVRLLCSWHPSDASGTPSDTSGTLVRLLEL